MKRAITSDLENFGTVRNSTVKELGSKLKPNSTVNYINQLWEDSNTLFNKIENTLISQSIKLFKNHILLQLSYHFYGMKSMNSLYYSALNFYDGNQFRNERFPFFLKCWRLCQRANVLFSLSLLFRAAKRVWILWKMCSIHIFLPFRIGSMNRKGIIGEACICMLDCLIFRDRGLM